MSENEDAYYKIREKVLQLRCEVNCRIEHGAESGGHLEYMQKMLDDILALEYQHFSCTSTS